MTQLNRKDLAARMGLLKNMRHFHAGWFQSYALDQWPESSNKGGEVKQEALERLSRCEPDEFYRAAFKRWQQLGQEDLIEQVELSLETRLYIGVTRDNALETGVTVSHTYGMPLIPGSAIKGVTRSWAEKLLKTDASGMDEVTFQWMFGEGGDSGESGGLVFHDAWWVPEPGQTPFVREIVTPHQQGYYSSEGKKAPSDFEDPVPAPQIAIQGKFLFTVEGPQPWVKVGLKLMERALNQYGVGSKTTSGYGYFVGS